MGRSHVPERAAWREPGADPVFCAEKSKEPDRALPAYPLLLSLGEQAGVKAFSFIYFMGNLGQSWAFSYHTSFLYNCLPPITEASTTDIFNQSLKPFLLSGHFTQALLLSLFCVFTSHTIVLWYLVFVCPFLAPIVHLTTLAGWVPLSRFSQGFYFFSDEFFVGVFLCPLLRAWGWGCCFHALFS